MAFHSQTVTCCLKPQLLEGGLTPGPAQDVGELLDSRYHEGQAGWDPTPIPPPPLPHLPPLWPGERDEQPDKWVFQAHRMLDVGMCVYSPFKTWV